MQKQNTSLPTISVILFAYNEEKNLKRLFASLKKQDYPRKKLEYILVNDGSTDKTAVLAKKFGTKVINVKTHDIELNKGIGMHHATGDYIYWMDADMEVIGKDFFSLLSKPLREDKKINASFTNEFALDKGKKVKSSLLRFISYDPLQRDPLYQFFSPTIESTVIEKRSDYMVCEFFPRNIPPAGRSMYRRKKLLQTAVGKDKAFIDLETLEIVSRAGMYLFAYVPKAKIRHYHAESLTMLIKKRLRNLERDYLPNIEHKYYTWFNLKKPSSVLKIITWVIYANLFFPELVRGGIRAIKHKDSALLWQPVVSILTTDLILWGFLKRKSGRELALKMLKNLAQ